MGEREIKYLETNSKRMMYGTFKKEGYFIGSGVIEAGCKTVVGKRTKQSGMFGQVKGAQNILNIRCAILGNTYDKFWECRNSAETTKLASEEVSPTFFNCTQVKKSKAEISYI